MTIELHKLRARELMKTELALLRALDVDLHGLGHAIAASALGDIAAIVHGPHRDVVCAAHGLV